MVIEKTNLDGVLLITPQVFGDSRGWFFESYSKIKLEKLGFFCDFVQDNHSKSEHVHTLRGLHFQKNPKAQAKLIRCVRGKILDVAVDIRKSSPNYLKWIGVELTEENKKQLFIPKGFAHGFLTLEANCEVMYKTDDYYSPECDCGIRWNDPDIGVEWNIDNPVLSQKDLNSKFIKEFDPGF